jgi:hypothetical protein
MIWRKPHPRAALGRAKIIFIAPPHWTLKSVMLN